MDRRLFTAGHLTYLVILSRVRAIFHHDSAAVTDRASIDYEPLSLSFMVWSDTVQVHRHGAASPDKMLPVEDFH